MTDRATADSARDSERAGGAPWWVFALLGLLVLGAGIGAYLFLTSGDDPEPAAPPPPPLVTAAQVSRAERVAIRQTGFVRPLAEVTVTAQVAGRIETVADSFQRGQSVAAGTVLVTLETARLEAAVDRAEAQVAQARAALAAGQLDRDRREQLEDSQFASEASLQDSIVAVASQEAQLAGAEADLIDAQNRLGDAQITAPFDALVTSAEADPGDLATAGADLGRLVALSAVEIELGLTPRDIALLGTPELALGGRVLLRGTGQATVGGEDRPVIAIGVVDAIGPEVSETTRTVPLLVQVPAPFDTTRDGRPLRVGELVELELPVDVSRRTALRLPARALKGGDRVWEVRDGALVGHEVSVLARQDAMVVVEAPDLPTDALVLVSELAGAVDGTRVRLERNREDAGQDGNGGAGD